MPPASPAPTKNARGLSCPRCQCEHLVVIRTILPLVNLRRRYRICAACGCRIMTEERIRRWCYKTPADAKALVAKLKKRCRQRYKSS